MKGTVICDGRGNAGTGAVGAVLFIHTGDSWGAVEKEVEEARKISPTTNIVAEHLSIQLGMEIAKIAGVTELRILNDSQTPVNHVKGVYKVKQEHLKPLVKKTWKMAEEFESVSIRWVPREETKRADALCRKVDRPVRPSSGRSRPGGPVEVPVRENPFLRQKP